jgi:hypothetical protein
MLVRAFVVNAAGFFCFEVGKRLVYESPKSKWWYYTLKYIVYEKKKIYLFFY